MADFSGVLDDLLSCLSHLKEKMPLWKQTTLGQVIGFHLRCVGMYAGIKVILCLPVRFNIQQASLEKKGDTVPP